MPISAGPYETGHDYNYDVLIPNHPLFDHGATLGKSEGYRIKGVLSEVGQIELVANWRDGSPACAVRYDLPGLVTNLTFILGSRDKNTSVCMNALFMDR